MLCYRSCDFPSELIVMVPIYKGYLSAVVDSSGVEIEFSKFRELLGCNPAFARAHDRTGTLLHVSHHRVRDVTSPAVLVRGALGASLRASAAGKPLCGVR